MSEYLQALFPVELGVLLLGRLEEAQGKIILSNSMQNQADVGVDQCHLGVILAKDDQTQIASAIKQLQSSAHLWDPRLLTSLALCSAAVKGKYSLDCLRSSKGPNGRIL
jgi:hypothetical protein